MIKRFVIQPVCRVIWDASEFTHIGLGPFAHIVFGGMIEHSGSRRIK